MATVEPPRVLVLAGADPKSRAALATPEDMAHAWQWLLRPAVGGRGIRLVARQRYCYPRRQAALGHFVEAVSFVMERRMLHGIKARAERRHPAPWQPGLKPRCDSASEHRPGNTGRPAS